MPRVVACAGAVVEPAVTLGVTPAPVVSVPAWLVDLQAVNASARNSKRKNSLRGIRISFQGISPILPVKPGSKIRLCLEI
jgi:hypothetical protein